MARVTLQDGHSGGQLVHVPDDDAVVHTGRSQPDVPGAPGDVKDVAVVETEGVRHLVGLVVDLPASPEDRAALIEFLESL